RATGRRVKATSLPPSIEGYDLDAIDPERWPAGEDEALRSLKSFQRSIDDYGDARDRYAEDGTSRLSPHLAVGSISIRQCLHGAFDAGGTLGLGNSGADVWIKELLWREFYRHLIVAEPRLSKSASMKSVDVRWREDEAGFEAWSTGRTGIPIVDAAMRQLLETSWMHNRLRMVVAMFLTKNLLIDWRRGERFFMEHLIDGDLASNNGGWQWAASTGADAAPYFRVFNPVSQSRRYDPDGTFLRRFLPELKDVDDPHDPADAARERCGYPRAIVDLKATRTRAIEAFRDADTRRTT
ncbi:MAG: hypothetical protein KDA28_08350, partial [Phycisphaerales bacterium]|nr:hypothetical protein [Phycisphaerales bacterium]